MNGYSGHQTGMVRLIYSLAFVISWRQASRSRCNSSLLLENSSHKRTGYIGDYNNYTKHCYIELFSICASDPHPSSASKVGLLPLNQFLRIRKWMDKEGSGLLKTQVEKVDIFVMADTEFSEASEISESLK